MEEMFKIEFKLESEMDWCPSVSEYEEALVNSEEKVYDYQEYFYLSKEEFFAFLKNEDFSKGHLELLRSLISEWNHLAIDKQRSEGLIEDKDVEYFETLFFDRTYVRCCNEDYDLQFQTICEVFDLELIEGDLARLHVRSCEVIHPSVKR